MGARLKAVAGPVNGDTFPLPDGEMTIGRDRDNDIAIAGDDRLSRRHAVIHGTHENFSVRHLSEQGRTYVNQISVPERLLAHGDEIRVGRSVFLFVVDGYPLPRPGPTVDLDDGGLVAGSRQTIGRGDVLYLDRDTVLETVPQSEKRAHIVQSVLKACRAVLSIPQLGNLQRHLIESILEAIPAKRAALLLLDEASNEFASARHWTREFGECEAFRIPQAVIRHVLTERQALCINDASYTVWSSHTTAHARLTSILAVPLLVSDEARGAFYMDVSDPNVRFGGDDLQLLTGVAEVSAGPLMNALRSDRLEQDNERLLAELVGHQPLVGMSARMQSVHRFVVKVAASDSTVLLMGASGTGKELVARAIHRASARATKAFAAVNCAAVADTLLESEFFGHEKGAFTGAYTLKKGKFEEADGGTVFLDEIGEMALPLQAKLLRVLQEREFQRVGGTRQIKVNIRIIAATNRNLEREIHRGTFREDLFYRLNVVALTMPELRERREDIPLLAMHFLQKHVKSRTRRISRFTDAAMACLKAYDWPGNVRELENVVERATVLGTTEQILQDDLPDYIIESQPEASESSTKFYETIKGIKRQLVTRALDDAGGSYTEAAKALGVHPNNLHRLMKTLNLKVRP